MTSLSTSVRSSWVEIFDECWVEITTVSTLLGVVPS